MKKALLLILLVPFIGLSQTNLVTWNVTTWPYPLTPTVASDQNLGASTLTGAGINFPSTGDSNGMITSGWPTTAAYSTTKYVQFTVSAFPNNSVTINQVNFEYRGDAKMHKIEYSKDNFATILTAYTYTNYLANAGDWTFGNNNQTFSTPLVLAAGEKLTARIYAAEGNQRIIKNITVNGSSTTPTGFTGTIYVGATHAAPFDKISSAAAALTQFGVSGNVTLLLDDTAYNNNTGETFPVTFGKIGGNTTANNSSASKTITIKPAPGVNTVVSGATAAGQNGLSSIFKFDSADYITVDGSNTANGTTRNLIVSNNNTPNYVDRAVFWLGSNGTDGATYITIKNVVIRQTLKSQGGKYNVGVYAASNAIGSNNGIGLATADGNNAYLTVKNNDFVNVKQGIFVNGNATTPTTNTLVSLNDLGAEDNLETIIQPASFFNASVFEFSENYIYNLRRETTDGDLVSAGVSVTGNSSNGFILKNEFSKLIKTTTESHTFAAILLSASPANTNILVANNFINDVTGTNNGGAFLNGHGIVVSGGGGYKIYHNTVVLTTNQFTGTGAGYSSALYIGHATGVGAANNNNAIVNLDVRNNIFVNRQTSEATVRSAITVVDYASNINNVFSNLNYNNYYSTNKFGFIASNTAGTNPGHVDTHPGTYYIPDFASWKATTGKDANSLNINPAFASATDIHINPYATQNADLVDKGTGAVNALVTKDIDGQVRKTNAPDMGADEFGPINAPAPSTTAGTSNNPGIYCVSSTTFNGYVNSVAQWSNGLPTSDKDVIFNANFVQSGGTLEACSIYVLAGKTVSFTNNATAIVQHSVNVADTGALTFANNCHLVQVEDDQNTGIVTVTRKGGLLKRLDYTFWSAPVTDARATNYQSLFSFSPLTLSNRFYNYTTSSNAYTAIASPSTTKFSKGKSYLIRMPNEDAATGYNAGTGRLQYNGVFTGTPNTGTVRYALERVGENGINAVGNPYPSPINIRAFLYENYTNSGVIDGTIWLWRKNNDATKSSYATFNLAGYVKNMGTPDNNPGGAQSDINAGNTLVINPDDAATQGTFNTGQGFLVRATAANKELVFKNNMRSGATHSDNFFRTAQDSTLTQGVPAFVGDRLWINVTGGEGFSESLIAYTAASSTAYEGGYDSDIIPGGNISLYSVITEAEATKTLVIQSRGSFTAQDAVQLGYVANVSGTYTFAIDHADGVFAAGQEVYIVDNMLGTTHRINANGYSFTTDAGTFNNRFQVVYKTEAQLGTDAPVADAKAVLAYRDGNTIKVTSSQEISAVAVYDTLGRMLFAKNNIDGMEFSTADLNIAQQVVIINVTLDNQQVVSKKIMMN
jgi:hypothetical protein